MLGGVLFSGSRVDRMCGHECVRYSLLGPSAGSKMFLHHRRLGMLRTETVGARSFRHILAIQPVFTTSPLDSTASTHADVPLLGSFLGFLTCQASLAFQVAFFHALPFFCGHFCLLHLGGFSCELTLFFCLLSFGLLFLLLFLSQCRYQTDTKITVNGVLEGEKKSQPEYIPSSLCSKCAWRSSKE